MAKYSFDFKLKVVKFYQKGNGYSSTADHFNIDHSTVKKWVKAYQYHGQSGIQPRTTKLSYSAEFKHYVLKFMSDHYYSAREAASYFNIPAFTSILEWQSLFKEGGLSALEPRQKGRPKKMRLPKKPDNRTEQEKLIDQLQAELAYLRAENDVLKKFQELDEKEEALRRKQSSQKNSK